MSHKSASRSPPLFKLSERKFKIIIPYTLTWSHFIEKFPQIKIVFNEFMKNCSTAKSLNAYNQTVCASYHNSRTISLSKVKWNGIQNIYFFQSCTMSVPCSVFSLKDPEKWPELTMKLPITKLFVQATTILEQFLYQKWSGMESK
jgi:hypothetical protein